MKYLLSKVLVVFMLIFSVVQVNAQNDDFIEMPEENQVALLLNMIQYSTVKILLIQDKAFLTLEKNGIIDNLEKSKLQDEIIIDSYGNLLRTMTELEIVGEKRKHLEKKMEMKKKNAIFNSLNSFGSVMFSPSPAGIAYAATSAAFNYARTVNDIKIEKMDEEFALNVDKIKLLEKYRADLFTESSKIYLKKNYSSKLLINEGTMKDFVKIALAIDTTNNIDVIKSNLIVLEGLAKDSVMADFSPFWLVLGKAYYLLNEESYYNRAVECFDKVFASKSDILRYNPYIAEAARLRLCLDMNNGRLLDVGTLFKLIEENTRPGIKDDIMRFMVPVFAYEKNWKKGDETLKYLYNRRVENEFGALACVYSLQRYDESAMEHKRAETMLKAAVMTLGLPQEMENTSKFEEEQRMTMIKNAAVLLAGTLNPPVLFFNYWQNSKKDKKDLMKNVFVAGAGSVDSVYFNEKNVNSLNVFEKDGYFGCLLEDHKWEDNVEKNFSLKMVMNDGWSVKFRKSEIEDETDNFVVKLHRYKKSKYFVKTEVRLFRTVISEISFMHNGDVEGYSLDLKNGKWVRAY